MANKGTVADYEYEVRTRIVDIESAPSGLQAVLYAADRAGRFFDETDLLHLRQFGFDAELIQTLSTLGSQAESIVDTARLDLLSRLPAITEPGGGLYPPTRAAACWRDLWHFLRCITYGMAIGRSQYTNAQGLARLRQLYQKLDVPLDAMLVALEALKQRSLSHLSPQQAAQQAPFFSHLIEQLRTFQQPAQD